MNAVVAVLLVALAICSTLGAGLEIDPRRLRDRATVRRPVAGALVAGVLVVPLIAALALPRLGLPADVAAALLVVAFAPGGASAPLLGRLAGGEATRLAAVYLVLAVASALLAPLASAAASPLLLLGIVAVQLTPLGVGLAARLGRAALAARLAGPVRAAGNLLLVAVIVVLSVTRGAELATLGAPAALAMVGLVALTMVAGAAAAPAPRAPDAVMAAVRNLTLGLLLSEARAPGGRATLLIAAYGLVMYLAAAGVALAARRLTAAAARGEDRP